MDSSYIHHTQKSPKKFVKYAFVVLDLIHNLKSAISKLSPQFLRYFGMLYVSISRYSFDYSVRQWSREDNGENESRNVLSHDLTNR